METMFSNKKVAKKGNVSVLTGIALGIVGLVVIVGIGITVLNNLGNSVGGGANTSIQYGITQLGSSGLLSWLPAVIALLIGVFFLSYFGGKIEGRSY